MCHRLLLKLLANHIGKHEVIVRALASWLEWVGARKEAAQNEQFILKAGKTKIFQILFNCLFICEQSSPV